MIRLGCTKGCSQEDQRKLILPASRRRSACELSIFLWGGYLTKAKPRGMQWKEEGVGGKLKWRGSPGTKADYINSRGGLARGSEGRKDVCPGSHWPTCFLENICFPAWHGCLAWLTTFTQTFHQSGERLVLSSPFWWSGLSWIQQRTVDNGSPSFWIWEKSVGWEWHLWLDF